MNRCRDCTMMKEMDIELGNNYCLIKRRVVLLEDKACEEFM